MFFNHAVQRVVEVQDVSNFFVLTFKNVDGEYFARVLDERTARRSEVHAVKTTR